MAAARSIHSLRAPIAALLLLALVVPSAASGAAPVERRHAGPLEKRFPSVGGPADSLLKLGQARAFAYCDSMVRVFGERRDVIGDAVARFWRARQRMRIYQPDKGRPDLDSVLAVARALRDTCFIARVWASRGHGAQITGRMAEAKKALAEAVRLSRLAEFPTLEGFAHRGLGYIAKEEGRYDDARRELTLAIRQVNPASFENIHSRLMLAEVMNRVGQHEEARVAMESVHVDARRRNDRWTTAASLHDLGNIAYEQGDMAAADRNWEYAAGVYDSTNNAPAAINVRVNRAQALTRLGRHDDARALLERLIAEGAKIEDQGPRIGALGEMGRLQFEQGRLREAERTLRGVRFESEGTDVSEHDFATVMLAWVLRESGRAAEVEALIDSLIGRSRTADMMPDDRAAALMARSAARRALGKNAEALAAARQAEKEARRGRDQGSIYWLDAAVEVGRCQRALGRPDSAVRVLAGAARVWERWRASISDLEWRERMASGLSPLFAEYGLALLDARRPAPPARRVREAFDALQAFQARTLEERMHGQGLSARAMSRRVTADSLRRLLRDGEVFVDLVATPDTTFAFLLSRRGAEAHLLPGTARLDRLFEDWRQAMLAGADRTIVEGGLRRLSNELLGPLAAPLRASRRVVLGGGGPLMLWPVAALTLPGETAPLGATREVAATPSATMFSLLRSRARPPAAPPRLLAVSRTTNAAGRALPGAERELRMLGSEYAGVTVRESRGDRTMAELTADLPRWDALHFAAHSEADGESPWRSGFLLGRGSSADAYFRASGVAGLKLRARLAVLSGCQSAGAATLAGEGALGLSAGFLCAGTTSVVATLWPVEDRTAQRFVTGFYAALAAGRTVSGATRDAQAALRGREDGANPRDWAAFVVAGEPSTTLPIKRKGLFQN